MNDISLRNKVSDAQPVPQQQLRLVPGLVPFDAAGGDGYADRDGNGHGDGPDNDPPPVSPIGALCRAARPEDAVATGFTLCAVTLWPDDPAEILDGQAITRCPQRHDAETCCVLYAHMPSELPRMEFRPTHLVVNDAKGREVFRQQIGQVAA